jgi:SAM-dependent methyltransferase
MESADRSLYQEDFYASLAETSLPSARVVAPMLVEWASPRSVVDFGCGSGMWLQGFQETGIEDVLGLDGEWVDRNWVKLPEEKFRQVNFDEPISLERTFDLAVSLEVAEHVRPEGAEDFVGSLCKASSLVLFSAAIPHQEGDHHVNLQWPSYWEALFAAQGYVALDCLRHRIWSHPEVHWWYAQNAVLFVHQDRLEKHPPLQELQRLHPGPLPSLVHPELFEFVVQGLQLRSQRLLPVLAALPRIAVSEPWRLVRKLLPKK